MDTSIQPAVICGHVIWLRAIKLVVLVLVVTATPPGWLHADDDEDEDLPREQVIIERAPVRYRDSDDFKVTMSLAAARTVTVVATSDGPLADVSVALGDQVQDQEQLARHETRRQSIALDRAKAALELAQLELDAAPTETKPIAEKRVSIAESDLSLAQLELDEATVRAPMDGVVVNVHVVAGEFVRKGDPLVTVLDPSRLVVELPVDRSTVKQGDDIEFSIEGTSVSGEATAILPLTEHFEPLRDLFASVAVANVVIENADGRFQPGQTVYSPMIPRSPVVEVPNETLVNTGEGERKVQVIRDGFVRDVVVLHLSSRTELISYVTGDFSPRDELVLKASVDLIDGARVVPTSGAEPERSTRTDNNQNQSTDRGAPAF